MKVNWPKSVFEFSICKHVRSFVTMLKHDFYGILLNQQEHTFYRLPLYLCIDDGFWIYPIRVHPPLVVHVLWICDVFVHLFWNNIPNSFNEHVKHNVSIVVYWSIFVMTFRHQSRMYHPWTWQYDSECNKICAVWIYSIPFWWISVLHQNESIMVNQLLDVFTA